MAPDWKHCKNILCIRPDNMGDLIMTGPALRALKDTFGATITILTSSMAAGIADLMPEIDEVITCDLPWVKTEAAGDLSMLWVTINKLQEKQFDAAIIFTVFSQNPLPTVMLAYLAGIPLRLAYCRENPYQLLTDWVPDEEPYSEIKHQVQRDLDLVAAIGATTKNENLKLNVIGDLQKLVVEKLCKVGVNTAQPWLVLHPGVSELKRQYPFEKWALAASKIIDQLGFQLIITGSASEKQLTEDLQTTIGINTYAAGGLFSLDEFVMLIQMARAVVSVNTGTVHIAAAVQTPCVVLYAQSNPQHTPWKSPHVLLPYSIERGLQSKNEVIRFVNRMLYTEFIPLPNERQIIAALKKLLQ